VEQNEYILQYFIGFLKTTNIIFYTCFILNKSLTYRFLYHLCFEHVIIYLCRVIYIFVYHNPTFFSGEWVTGLFILLTHIVLLSLENLSCRELYGTYHTIIILYETKIIVLDHRAFWNFLLQYYNKISHLVLLKTEIHAKCTEKRMRNSLYTQFINKNERRNTDKRV